MELNEMEKRLLFQVEGDYTVPGKSIEALSLSDYNHLRDILGFSSVSISNNEFLVHCDTWNYVDDIQQRLEQ